jgi:hypothetical protein
VSERDLERFSFMHVERYNFILLIFVAIPHEYYRWRVAMITRRGAGYKEGRYKERQVKSDARKDRYKKRHANIGWVDGKWMDGSKKYLRY